MSDFIKKRLTIELKPQVQQEGHAKILGIIIAGSSWTQEIVWEILHDGKVDKRRLDERMPFIEGMIFAIESYPYVAEDAKSVGKIFTSFPTPRVFKTHLTYEMIPKGSVETTKPRYIYVMRNPKDVLVSTYHHRCNMPYIKGIPTWDEAFEHFMEGKGKLSY